MIQIHDIAVHTGHTRKRDDGTGMIHCARRYIHPAAPETKNDKLVPSKSTDSSHVRWTTTSIVSATRLEDDVFDLRDEVVVRRELLALAGTVGVAASRRLGLSSGGALDVSGSRL